MDATTLKTIRQTSGLGYRPFAHALGIGKSTLSRYETGLLPVPRKIVLALAGLEIERGASHQTSPGGAV